MARIFITGSADGLGQLAATKLVREGHQVVLLHARNKQRGQEAMANVSGAETVVQADLSSLTETKQLAKQVNDLGDFDAVIHNAGVYRATGKEKLNVNTLAPYILTCLIRKPKRLIYLSSGLHQQGDTTLRGLKADGAVSYSDSKLHDIILTMAVARKWPDVFANAVNPGWVPTRMGGKGAPDDLDKGCETQVWLATSDEAEAKVSGKYFFHKRERAFHQEASKVEVQDQFLQLCAHLTGITFPER